MSDDKLNRWSVAVPLALLVVGGCALLGCFPIPGNFGAVGGDARPEKKIGKADSDALIRLGVSDRERVRDVLGEPTRIAGDGRAWLYDYNVVPGYIVWPLCFGANRVTSARYLAIRFDDTGVLRAYRVTKNIEAADDFLGGALTIAGRQEFERKQAEREARRRTMTKPAKASTSDNGGSR